MLISKIARRMNEDPEQFSLVDRAGLAFYLEQTASDLQE
jgi:hypothetical protein